MLHPKPYQTAVFIFLFFFSSYLLIHTPVFGWDTLNFWAPQAVNFATGHYELVDPLGARHPLGLPLILAFIAKATDFVGMWAHLIFLFLFTFTACIAIRYSGLKEGGSASIIFLIFCFTTPLLENHLQIIGYTEILACAGSLLIVTMLSAIFEGRGDLGTYVAALAGTLLLIFSRNTGWFILVVAVLVTAVVFASSISKKQRFFMTVASVFLFFIGAFSIKVSSGFDATDPFLSFEENEIRFVGLQQCDAGVRDVQISVRALDAGKKDLPTAAHKSKFPATIYGNDLGVDCVAPLGDLPRGTNMVLLELYGIDGDFLNWAYIYPDTTIISLGQSLRILYGGFWQIEAFGWKMQPAFPQYEVVLKTFFEAVIKNASFSILFFMTLVCSCILRLNRELRGAVFAHFCTYWGLLIVYVVTQFILDRMLTYSIPGRDTFGSRFILIGSVHALFGLSLTLHSAISHQLLEKVGPSGYKKLDS